MKRPQWVVLAVVAVALATWLVWRSVRTPPRSAGGADGAAAPVEGTPAWVEPEPGAPSDRLHAYDAPGAPPSGDDAGPRLDRQRRDAMRELIYRAWSQTPPPEGTAAAAAPSAKVLDKDYIRSRIREDYIPLAKDCYEQGLKKNPKLAGKIVADFSIVGNKNVGGIIDEVAFDRDGGTTLGDPDVLECLKQSLYSVTFEPPPDDGKVTVTYPISFSPDAPDAGDAG